MGYGDMMKDNPVSQIARVILIIYSIITWNR